MSRAIHPGRPDRKTRHAWRVSQVIVAMNVTDMHVRDGRYLTYPRTSSSAGKMHEATSSISSSTTPTGFGNKARGWSVATTLGMGCRMIFNPNGVGSWAASSDINTSGLTDTSPVVLGNHGDAVTQGDALILMHISNDVR